MNKGGPHIEAPPKRTSLYLKIEEVILYMYGFQKIEPKEKIIVVLMSDNNNKMQNMCTLETWENLRKCPKTPTSPPSWKPEPQS
jgi:hypothetical protein